MCLPLRREEQGLSLQTSLSHPVILVHTFMKHLHNKKLVDPLIPACILKFQ